MSTERDYTKYRFDGQELGKGRLVLALVKRYVADNPGILFDALREAFPDSMQAESPTQFSAMRTVVSRVRDIAIAQEGKRYFLGDGETIQLADGEVAVSREWNRFNVENVLRKAGQWGYEAVAVDE